MRTGIHQPIPVRWPPAQKPPLLPGLRVHRGQHPMPRPQHFPLRLRAKDQHQRLMRRTRDVHTTAGLGQPDLDPSLTELAATSLN